MSGYAEYIFNTSLLPEGPGCRVIKGAGSGHEARNTLACNDWTSSSGSTALVYDYFYKTSPNDTEYLIQTTRHARISNIRLPPGLEKYNYTLYMKAVISDKMGSRSEVPFEYQVRLHFVGGRLNRSGIGCTELITHNRTRHSMQLDGIISSSFNLTRWKEGGRRSEVPSSKFSHNWWFGDLKL